LSCATVKLRYCQESVRGGRQAACLKLRNCVTARGTAARVLAVGERNLLVLLRVAKGAAAQSCA